MTPSNQRIVVALACVVAAAVVAAAMDPAAEDGRLPMGHLSPAKVAGLAAAPPPGPLPPPRVVAPLQATHLPASVAAGTLTTEEAIDRCVLADMARLDAPGAQVAVVIDGQPAYQRGYGVRHRRNGGAVDAQTVFRIGSLTKQFTAAAVLQQVEAGTLALDERITRLVPELQVSGAWSAETITIFDLLTHTSAFPDNLTELDGPREDEALAAWAGQQGHVKLHAPPGSFWNYSNPGYMLAGLAVERASGIPYRSYVEGEVFARAGMTATTFRPEVVRATGNYTYGHVLDAARRETILAPTAYDSAAAAPAGFAFSTAGDLVHWASLLMEGGGSVLSAPSAAALQAPQVYMDYTPDLWYGFGVIRQAYKGLATVWHDGSIPGWGSVLVWVGEHRLAVAVLSNQSEPLYAAAFCVVDEILRPQEVVPPPYTTDPATWTRYTGAYRLMDYLGNELEAEVFLDGDRLMATFRGFEPAGDTYTTRLWQSALDTFVFDADGDGAVDLDATFVRSAPVAAKTRWLRHRYVVGERSLVPRRTLP